MDAEDLISLLLRQELDETLSVEVGLCSRVGGKYKFANIVFDAVCLEVLFCLSDPGDFGVGIHNGRNGVVVDVSVPMLDVLDSSDTCHGDKSLSRSVVGSVNTTNLPLRPCGPT